MVLSDVAFLDCDGCMRVSFDMPCTVSAQGGEWVIAAYHGSVGKGLWCSWGVFVNGCHVHVLKSGTSVPAKCLGEFTGVVVVVEGSVSFCLSDPWPVSFEEGAW